MNTVLVVSLGIIVVFLVILGKVAAKYRRDGQLVPDYRGMFASGVALMMVGLATNLGLVAAGLGLVAVGWRNRDQWGQHTKWADYPPTLKKLKLAFAGGLSALAVSVAIFYIVSNTH